MTRFVLDSARKDLARRLGDPIAFVFWILVPVTIGGLMALVSSEGGGPRVRLLLADQDGTFLGDRRSRPRKGARASRTGRGARSCCCRRG